MVQNYIYRIFKDICDNIIIRIIISSNSNNLNILKYKYFVTLEFD